MLYHCLTGKSDTPYADEAASREKGNIERSNKDRSLRGL